MNRTAFHNWERRAPSDRALTDAWLIEKIKLIPDRSRGVYGAPRIHAELRLEHDIRIGRKRVARLMKAAGISGVRPRKRWRTTIRIPGITPATDLVERQFRPTRRTCCGSRISLPADWGGLAVPRGRAGRLLPPDRRLVNGHAHARELGGRRATDGARAPTTGPRADPPLRPGLAVHQPGVRTRRRRGRDRGLDGLPRRRVRQRRRRDVLRHAQERARQPPQLASRLELQSAVFEYIEAFYKTTNNPARVSPKPGQVHSRNPSTQSGRAPRWRRRRRTLLSCTKSGHVVDGAHVIAMTAERQRADRTGEPLRRRSACQGGAVAGAVGRRARNAADAL